jgi:predicted DNA-binding antitoxin AbrB/MazE fold protein
MSQIITATYVNGMLKPEEDIGLASGTKVRLIVDLPDDPRAQRQAACAELDRLCDAFLIDSAGRHLTREQLHERR